MTKTELTEGQKKFLDEAEQYFAENPGEYKLGEVSAGAKKFLREARRHAKAILRAKSPNKVTEIEPSRKHSPSR